MENEVEKLEETQLLNRRSRSSGGRESSNRSIELRKPIAFGHISRFFFPESVNADEENECSWAAIMLRGEDFRESYNRAVHKGWTKLDPSRYPDLKRIYKNDIFRKRELESDAIFESGQIALVRPSEAAKEEKKYWSDKRRSSLESINRYIEDKPSYSYGVNNDGNVRRY